MGCPKGEITRRSGYGFDSSSEEAEGWERRCCTNKKSTSSEDRRFISECWSLNKAIEINDLQCIKMNESLITMFTAP